MAEVDPITLEIIRGSLASAIRDMELLMERCAMSPFIKEKKDYFVGIYDRAGNTRYAAIDSAQNNLPDNAFPVGSFDVP